MSSVTEEERKSECRRERFSEFETELIKLDTCSTMSIVLTIIELRYA